jgi:hypothetical protein
VVFNEEAWKTLADQIVVLGKKEGASAPANERQEYLQAFVNGLLRHDADSSKRGLFAEASRTLFGDDAEGTMPTVVVRTDERSYVEAVRRATYRHAVEGMEIAVIYPDDNGQYQVYIRPSASDQVSTTDILAVIHETAHAVLFARSQGLVRSHAEFSELLVDRFLEEALKGTSAEPLAVAADFKTLSAMGNMQRLSGLGLWLGRSLLEGLIAKANSLANLDNLDLRTDAMRLIFSLDFEPALSPVLSDLAKILLGETKLVQPLYLIVDVAAFTEASPEERDQLANMLSSDPKTFLYIVVTEKATKTDKLKLQSLLDPFYSKGLKGQVKVLPKTCWVVGKSGSSRTMHINYASLNLPKSAIVRVITGEGVKVEGINPDLIIRIVGRVLNAINVTLLNRIRESA